MGREKIINNKILKFANWWYELGIKQSSGIISKEEFEKDKQYFISKIVDELIKLQKKDVKNTLYDTLIQARNSGLIETRDHIKQFSSSFITDAIIDAAANFDILISKIVLLPDINLVMKKYKEAIE